MCVFVAQTGFVLVATPVGGTWATEDSSESVGPLPVLHGFCVKLNKAAGPGTERLLKT